MSDEREVSILIVDDEEPVRNLLDRLLSDEYTCITASTAQEASMLLSNGCFSLVITDLRLPDESGLVLCDFVRRTHPEAVVIVTSRAVEKDNILLNKVFDWIEKPFDLSRVQMSVRRAISYHRLKRSLT